MSIAARVLNHCATKTQFIIVSSLQRDESIVKLLISIPEISSCKGDCSLSCLKPIISMHINCKLICRECIEFEVDIFDKFMDKFPFAAK